MTGKTKGRNDPLEKVFVHWDEEQSRRQWMDLLLSHLSDNEKKALRQLIEERQAYLEERIKELEDKLAARP